MKPPSGAPPGASRPPGSRPPPSNRARPSRPARASGRPSRRPSRPPSRPSIRPGVSTRLSRTTPWIRPPGRSSPFAWLAAALVALAGIYLTLVFGYAGSSGPGNGREVELDWPARLSPEDSAERLYAAGLVVHPRLFALYLRATGSTEALRAGHHLLTDDLTPRALVRRMQRSVPQERVKVRIPEGFTRFDIARRLQNSKVCSTRAFLDATVDPELLARIGIAADSAEGYLFPATYELALDSEPASVITRMKAEFDKRFERLTRDNATGTDFLKTRMGWSTAEIVTMASIVEKEAAHDDERPLIASVFMNRLRDPSFTPKRLQSDPTSAYGCIAMGERIGSCRWYTGKVTPDINADETNPYTTYRHEGLPPGPIANPGEKSVQAVLVPAESHYLYFVARGEGRHTFSETYAQHNEAIRRIHAAAP